MRPTPHVLDDDTVGRLVELYTKQRDDLWLWDEQLMRWSGEALNVMRRREVERLQGQMAVLHKGKRLSVRVRVEEADSGSVCA